MFRGKISKNGIVVDLECDSAGELASIINATINGGPTAVRVDSSATNVRPISSKTSVTRRRRAGAAPVEEWTAHDVLAVARLYTESAMRGKSHGVLHRIDSFLRASGDTKNRSIDSIRAIIYMIQAFLTRGEKKYASKRVISILEVNGFTAGSLSGVRERARRARLTENPTENSGNGNSVNHGSLLEA